MAGKFLKTAAMASICLLATTSVSFADSTVSGTVSNKLKDGKKVTNTVTWQRQQGVHRQHHD
jgi:hypothetical protein